MQNSFPRSVEKKRQFKKPLLLKGKKKYVARNAYITKGDIVGRTMANPAFGLCLLRKKKKECVVMHARARDKE